MEMLNYEEQSILKMFNFSSKEELKKKLNKSLKKVDDTDMKETIKSLLEKIEGYTVEELKNIENVFE